MTGWQQGMTGWQQDLLERLISVLPAESVSAYGSVTRAGELDRWSDLDVRVRVHHPLHVERALAARLWTWQEHRGTTAHELRLVTTDGRRVDMTIDGPPPVLPRPPADQAVRFDAALAAVRLGRGNLLIGLHLVLGIGREALVRSMETADLATGTVHHRLPTPFDARAAEVAALTDEGLHPAVALRAYELYGEWRAALEPGYHADASGLVSVLRRGTAPTS
jgi:hypothetical protein